MPVTRAHRTVARVDRILDLVARSSDPPTLTEITAILGLPRSTVADLLRELREHGYVRLVGRRYRLGARCHVLSRLSGVGSPTRIDHARLAELSEIARTPLALAVMVGSEILYLDSAGPRAPEHLQRVADDHRPRPALRTAAGRLLLAFAASDDRAATLRSVLDEPDAVAAFERERPAIQHTRVARSDGVADPGVRALAVPVVEEDEVVAAIVLFAPRRARSGADPARGEHDPGLERAAARLVAALADQP